MRSLPVLGLLSFLMLCMAAGPAPGREKFDWGYHQDGEKAEDSQGDGDPGEALLGVS